MSQGLYLWVKSFHLIGVFLWGGSMVALAATLVSVGRAAQTGATAARDTLLGLGKGIARMMELGALVAIGCAVWLAVGTRGDGAAWVMKKPWMHVKLTLVVLVLFATHGLLRVKLARYRKGKQPKALPGFVVPLVIATMAAILILAVARPIGS
jgi:uncharacterized membrane protein